ncbi:tRNA preQ1(34) S-adenosylmethionine ribosyltransferase-isomerase QueA [Helcococcus kunzii]|uniref:tRNA preQ1(34) S-adenosylmethionine ribosyltransferase-isomerase QueA n=1 Tax=Helcococcus kunzii TaxID=40091 RepID=UPI0021A34B80|nr:tRNA preQ1(34) S-adenosylmethionine ribosyltransferase-isomerase QueA [Helcococcus kunzii]MCT1795496.1 tRNA preQ1(34) S-adenosylmethionine ribosyltransferase-isomerase QueA [Helcococcus kunzii]MCT1989176.1 tRNA preQ1(34) S-adenosylmethionine ribosyltransferase-isomerase QueA [Helcococcus kunzii]
METKDFDYDLDPSFIAQHPEEKRTESKLMILNRKDNTIEHKHFYDIIDYLNPGDCLVVNNSRVIPARLYGHRKDREEMIEVFLLKNVEDKKWECLVKPGKKMKMDTEIIFSEKLKAKVIGITDEGHRILDMQYDGIFNEILEEIGNIPLPPYITEKLEDKSKYQTVYAKHDGSVAAPTAGLHFTKELLEKIKEKGIKIAYVTLHVGLGTFKPVSDEKIENHKMHSEYYVLDKENSDIINETRKNNGRVIAVGTTSVRTLESIASKYGEIRPDNDWTEIFIYPGYEFKVIDAMITNFHLPKSTLIMLVSSFYDRENILKAYEEAKSNNYRFFSFGDAMFIN